MSNIPKKPFSYHIFLFPFKWDYFSDSISQGKKSFIERTRLEDIREIMETVEKQWIKYDFKFKTSTEDNYNNYNEYTYFHDFVRASLAIHPEINKNREKKKEAGTLQYNYSIKDKNKAQFIITIKKDKAKVRKYRLFLNEVILNFYDIGVGFLSFHLENINYDAAADILEINDYGRRIYPPFLGVGHPHTCDPKEYSSLPDSIELLGIAAIDGSDPIREDFSYYNDLVRLAGNPIRLPRYISALLPKSFVFQKANSLSKNPHVAIQPIIDDRMFVMSYYFNDQQLDEIKAYVKRDQTYQFQSNDFWYAYLFIDSPHPSIASPEMKAALLKKQSYQRWLEQESGHLFGISRYSFVILANEGFFNRKILSNHFKYIYFQMIALSLVQRAGILRFSGEASNIVTQLKLNTGNQSSKLISELYLEYIYFVNKIYHREVSSQEQGIELYQMLQDIMGIAANVTSLDREIEELNNYARMIEDAQRSQDTKRLTWVATLFLPPTLVAAIFGFSNISPEDISIPMSIFLWLGISIGFILVIFAVLFLVSILQKTKR